MTNIILASGSKYKAALLCRLSLPFAIDYPNINEYATEGELPNQTAERLALKKAKSVARNNIGAIVIGSDQIADLYGQAINKPENHTTAVEQLKRQSGREVTFHSGLAIVRCRPNGKLEYFSCVNSTTVIFRTLHEHQIESYLRTEEPYDCAGSFKAEGLGISLFTSIESTDPTSLIGLPLIDVCSLLIKFDVKINNK